MKISLKLITAVCILAVVASCSRNIATTTQIVTAPQPITVTQTETTTLPATTTQFVTVMQDTTITQTVTTIVTVPTVIYCNTPADFYIIYESTWYSSSLFRALLDTRSGIIGAYTGEFLGGAGYFSTDYRVPCERLQVVYDGIAQYDLMSLNGSLIDNTIAVPDNRVWRLTFCLNGEEYQIIWDTTTIAGTLFSDEYQRLSTFISIMRESYADSAEYQSLWPLGNDHVDSSGDCNN